MRFAQEGRWIISTPIYLGADPDVRKAMKCPHEEYEPGPKEIKEGHLIVMERCKACVATRVRYRPATADEIAELKK